MKRSKRQGFSLTELLVVLAIAGVVAGLAIVSFIGASKNLRLSSAANALNQSLINARQQAITSRSARRVAINLTNGTYWIERKNVEATEWTEGGRNALRVSEVERVAKNILIADIAGFTEAEITVSQGARKIWYVEFDNRGTAINYPENGVPGGNPVVEAFRTRPWSQRSNLTLHLIMDNTRIPVDEQSQLAYNLRNAALVSFINSIEANDEDGNEQDDGNTSVAIEVSTEARRQTVSVFVLALTGRSKVFEYGYGFPWSETDVLEQ